MITITTQSPSENAVVATASVTIRVAASSDAGTITGGIVMINGGTNLVLSFDAATSTWTRSVSIPNGPVLAKITMTDSTSATQAAYINFSRSTSTGVVALIKISHPTDAQVLRAPGVVLQADVTRPTDIQRVEASVDQGVSWTPMAIPPSSGGS